jgi:cytochrome bd-type quinol oxidase subunit 2
MDVTFVVFLFVCATFLFALLAFAKDSEGKRYGVKKMAVLWFAALPYFLSAAVEFTAKHADGGTQEVKITYSTWFLLALPVAMVVDNIARRRKANLAQSQRPNSTG